MYDTRSDARESLRLLVIATAVTLALWFVPFASYLLYPLRLFVTYVHEICHATAALLTLGWPSEIEIYWDTSGITRISGGLGLVVYAAGYVGTPLVGATLLMLAARARTVRPALVGTGLVVLAATAVLGGNLLTWVSGLGLGAALVAFGASARPSAARFGLSFLALQCILGAVGDLRTLFWLSAAHPEITTDAQLMSEATAGLVPAVVWTVLWALLSLGVLAIAFRAYTRATLGPREPFA
jgi:hypothetical protein